ncbi:MAG: lysophospholipid acyltransferase family protein, partial [Bdellovibrionota bacterium]
NNYLMVGNHMGYMDILVVAAQQSALFVTSEDMGEVPVLGHITKMAGCIFIERRNRTQVDRDIGAMTEALKQGLNILIYPEGTSSNGQQVLPFKKSLLMAAVEAGRDIQPICLKYTEIDGEPFGPHNSDKICWYGDMTFAPHFFAMAKLKSVKAEVHFLEPIKVTKESTRNELAEKAYRAINDEYMKGRDPIAAPSTAPAEMSEVESQLA